MLTRKYLESDEAKDIYLKLGRKCQKDLTLLNQGLKRKGNIRIDLPNSSVEIKGNNTTITQSVKLDDSNRVIKVTASKDNNCDFYDINLNIKEEGTDLITGEGYSRNIANINYFYLGHNIIITRIKDADELQKEEQARLEAVQRKVKATKVS